jgi:hypothetical protein
VPFRGQGGTLFGAGANRELPDWAGEIGAESWAQVFLKYHAEDNTRAGLGRLPDEALRGEIKRFWDQLA